MIALFGVGAYRGTWKHFGSADAVVFAKGVVLGTVSAIIVLLFAYHFEQYSRGVFPIYAALFMLLLSASRVSFRLVGGVASLSRPASQRCIIYGISGASAATIREAFHRKSLNILGFADDDSQQTGQRIAGYTVLGDSAYLLALIEDGGVDCVVVNTPIADVERLQALEAACRASEVDLLKVQLNLKPFHVAS